MRQLLSIVVFVMALAALLSPSVAVGVRALPLQGPAVTVSATAATDIELVSPCAQQGGTRVLPCAPDLGVLSRAQRLAAATASVVYVIGDDAMRRSALPARTLPPPRRA